MSKIITRSVFYFGHVITIFNRALDFDEGGGELQATLQNGDYTLTEFAAEIQRAMRAAGTQAYIVSVNRTTRKITISAPLSFDLLANSGSRVGTSVWTLMGFTTVADYTGTNTYTSDNESGSEYQTQYPVDRYVSSEHSIELENATKNTTPLGITQAASFGDGSRIQMNIRLITDLTGLKNEPFFENVTGINDFLTFFRYLIDNNRVEFMPDVADRATFHKVVIESIQGGRDGLSGTLVNMKDAANFYQSGVMTFRKVLV